MRQPPACSGFLGELLAEICFGLLALLRQGAPLHLRSVLPTRRVRQILRTQLSALKLRPLLVLRAGDRLSMALSLLFGTRSGGLCLDRALALRSQRTRLGIHGRLSLIAQRLQGIARTFAHPAQPNSGVAFGRIESTNGLSIEYL